MSERADDQSASEPLIGAAFPKSWLPPAAKEILLNAKTKFPKEAIIKYNLACYCCQMGDTENAKSYLKQAFEIDSSWRLKALDDEDLRPLWDSL